MNAERTLVALAILAAVLSAPRAQDRTGSGQAPEQDTKQATFDDAASKVQQQLEASLAELSALREQLAAEKIPLNRQLSDLEAELVQVRQRVPGEEPAARQPGTGPQQPAVGDQVAQRRGDVPLEPARRVRPQLRGGAARRRARSLQAAAGRRQARTREQQPLRAGRLRDAGRVAGRFARSPRGRAGRDAVRGHGGGSERPGQGRHVRVARSRGDLPFGRRLEGRRRGAADRLAGAGRRSRSRIRSTRPRRPTSPRPARGCSRSTRRSETRTRSRRRTRRSSST